MQLRAEIIAIGDEIVSGQRLDTNSQWLSHELGNLGVEVAYHSSVGDHLNDNIDVFRHAAKRVDLVISTGGLGPTSDDLTRQAMAQAANVELEFHPEVIEHIQKIFARYSREMPKSNEIQALFPTGARVVENPEGTAPGIDFDFPGTSDHACRFFALPGVPAEMKQMWYQSVAPAIEKMSGAGQVIHHHVLHCFGVGESQCESMLPNFIERGRDPKVGITASAATISLRVSARDQTVEQCIARMQPTLDEIRAILGDLVFGENGQQLHEVVFQNLQALNHSVSIVDFGLQGDVAKNLMSVEGPSRQTVRGGLVLPANSAGRWLGKDPFDLGAAATKVRGEFDSEIGVAIGELQFLEQGESKPELPSATFALAIDSPYGSHTKQLQFAGHSEIRQPRSVKQVLNELRLLLNAALLQNGPSS